MDITQALAATVGRQNLLESEMKSVMMQIMTGNATDAQIGGLLVALRMKGESVAEIIGAANVMRELAIPVSISIPNAVDIVGTGGDSANLFNVSSASSFVVAAAGGRVAKHGNRSVSSNSGSADLLEIAGINLELNPEQIAQCIEQVGLGFMFAPQHHTAMKHAVGPRKEMGLRTLFNILGPLTNPAGVKHYLLGVFDKTLCKPMAEALKSLGAVHAMVVHAAEGLDEISLAVLAHVDSVRGCDVVLSDSGRAHKTIVDDSSKCSNASADYLLVFRRSDEKKVPIAHPIGLLEYSGERKIPPELFQYKGWTGKQTENRYSHWIWRQYASSFWDDIRIDRVLPYKESREPDDEKHVHPLQLDVIDRCVTLWSNPGDKVLTPFMGIGSEVYGAVKAGRKGIGIELKESYYRQAVKNVYAAATGAVENNQDSFNLGETA